MQVGAGGNDDGASSLRRVAAVVLHDPHGESANLWGAFDRVRRNVSDIRLYFRCRGLESQCPPPPAPTAEKGAGRAVLGASEGAFRVAGCERRKWQGAIARCCKVRCSGVAPCDLFLIILGETEPDGDLDANVLGVSGMGRASVRKRALAWIRKPSPSPAAGRCDTFVRSTRTDSTRGMSKTASWSICIIKGAISKPGRHGGRPSRNCANMAQDAHFGRAGLCPVQSRSANMAQDAHFGRAGLCPGQNRSPRR